MSKEAMKRISDNLKKAGATLPAPEITGTIEGSMITGLCIALAIVEQEIEALAEQPAQRTWVGLTDEEKRQIFKREDYQGWLDYINAIEAKLKEKNT